MNIGIISTLRPDLLGRTLASFRENALRDVAIGAVFVNLDRAFGGDAELTACETLIRSHFPEARIHTPQTPGFTRAVMTVWSQMPDGPFLYLEDDWVCLHDIDLDPAAARLTDGTTMVSFLTKEHGGKGRREYSLQNDRPRLFGWPVGPARRVAPAFNTSPGLIDGAFARACAARMDPALDPEKQMRFGGNDALMRYVSEYRCRFLKAPDGGPLIRDIGRDWHAERGVRKVTDRFETRWETTGE